MKQRKPILLLHGALGSQLQLSTLKNQLTAEFEVHSLNFEGHGGRQSDKDFSIGLFSANVVSYLTENNIGSCHVFGYSMGGYVALQLARQQPELIDKIVTFGTKFDWSPETSAKEVKMLNPDVIAEKVPQFATHLKAIHGAFAWKEVLNKTADMMIALGAQPPLGPDSLAKIEQQTLICIGSEDNMVSIEESRAAANSLKNGTLKVLEGFKHPLERNDPVAMAEVIRQYIDTP